MTNVQIIVEGFPPVEFDADEIEYSDSLTGFTLSARRAEPLKRGEMPPTGTRIADIGMAAIAETLGVEMRPDE